MRAVRAWPSAEPALQLLPGAQQVLLLARVDLVSEALTLTVAPVACTQAKAAREAAEAEAARVKAAEEAGVSLVAPGECYGRARTWPQQPVPQHAATKEPKRPGLGWRLPGWREWHGAAQQ